LEAEKGLEYMAENQKLIYAGAYVLFKHFIVLQILIIIQLKIVPIYFLLLLLLLNN